MEFPFSTVITALLKGNMFAFGVPAAREMSDFGALLTISARINMEEKKDVINRDNLVCIIVNSKA